MDDLLGENYCDEIIFVVFTIRVKISRSLLYYWGSFGVSYT